MDAILRPQHVEVSADGPVVVLQIGHHVARMHYRVALRVSQHLRLHARVTSIVNHDGRTWVEIGVTEEQQEINAARKKSWSLGSWLRNITMAKPLEPAKPGKKIGVEPRGEEVLLWLGNTAVGFHYTAALQISEWLRIRAKEAKSSVGDRSRELSIIGTLHNATPRD